MEKGKVLVKMEIKREGNLLFIGDSPQLIVNLESQENYIKIQDRMLPYYREVALSKDLLGERIPKDHYIIKKPGVSCTRFLKPFILRIFFLFYKVVN